MQPIRHLKDRILHQYKSFPDEVITILLIVVGVALILFALLNHNPLAKAAALAWVTLP